MKQHFAVAGIAMMISATAQAGELAHFERDVTGVDRVSVAVAGDIEIRPGSNDHLEVIAEQSVIDALDITVDGNTLSIASRAGFRTQRSITFRLSLRRFSALTSDASGDALVEGFRSPVVTITQAGTGDIRLNRLQADTLTLDMPGSGMIHASGQGERLISRIEGAGEIDAAGYAVTRADAAIDGSGLIAVHAAQQLTARIDGAGDITYDGSPTVHQSITGVGSIARR